MSHYMSVIIQIIEGVYSRAVFFLAMILLFSGQRRIAQVLALAGITIMIYLLYLYIGEGRGYLKETDFTVKMVMSVVAAWIA